MSDDLVKRLRANITYSYMPMAIRHQLAEAAERIERLERAIERQASAVRTLQNCEETEINRLRSKERDAHAAVSTLDSEREANAILTAQIETAEHQRDEALAALREALDAASRVAEAEINNAGTGDGWQSACNIRNEILALIEKETK